MLSQMSHHSTLIQESCGGSNFLQGRFQAFTEYIHWYISMGWDDRNSLKVEIVSRSECIDTTAHANCRREFRGVGNIANLVTNPGGYHPE